MTEHNMAVNYAIFKKCAVIFFHLSPLFAHSPMIILGHVVCSTGKDHPLSRHRIWRSELATVWTHYASRYSCIGSDM